MFAFYDLITFFYFKYVSYINQEKTLTNFNMTSILNQENFKNKGGRPSSSIWEDITRGTQVAPGKYQATCKYCSTTWTRGELSKLEEHLANHCPEAPGGIVRKYLTKILEREDKSNKKRKISDNNINQPTITEFHDSTKISDARVTRINRALIKFIVACGISFRVVEHPFFINFVKELNAAYDPSTREYLSDQLLERELAAVNSHFNSVIEKESNLTLGLLILFFIK